jgi:16S rRNA (guanine527-N7)-methyltransferase
VFHVEHAGAFVAAVGDRVPAVAADLGSGGGIPGLVLATVWPSSRWTFIEVNERRAAFLRRALLTLDLSGRCRVDERRAEIVGRAADARGAFDTVTARGFGSPAVVVECGAPLLRVGGRLLVSEPPEEQPSRWPAGGVGQLGLAVRDRLATPTGTIQVLEQVEPCSDVYPRRVGVPARRPLFDVSRETSPPDGFSA